MPDALPVRLEREPLIDAIFEFRLAEDASLSELLPGALFASLDPKPKIQRLPPAEIPMPLRKNEPNLKNAPVVRLDLENYTISVGDLNVVIGANMPYPGWAAFKNKILEITQMIAGIGINNSVKRFSMKYVNLLPGPNYADQLDQIKLNIELGDAKIDNDHLSLQVHRKEDDLLHIITVVTGATAKHKDGQESYGAVVDIDTICELPVEVPFSEFGKGLEESIEGVRQSNKAKFFGCLQEKAIEAMGPIYD